MMPRCSSTVVRRLGRADSVQAVNEFGAGATLEKLSELNQYTRPI